MLIPFTTVRLRLIDDAHKAWRFSSLRCLAIGGACQAAVICTPDKVAQYAPSWLMSGLSTAAVICTVLAGIGRMTTIEPKRDDDVDHHEHLQDSDH